MDEGCHLCESHYTIEDAIDELPCGHQFHKTCLAHHFQDAPNCPTCKKLVPGVKSSWMLGGDTLDEFDLDIPTAAEDESLTCRQENGEGKTLL